MLKETMHEIAGHAGITVNGRNPWDIEVRDDRLYKRIWRDQSLGLGESYMDGWWECDRIDIMIHKILASGLENKVKGNFIYLLRFLPAIFFNLQSARRSRIIADRHYDLGNDLFFSFLDPDYKQYSCGYFAHTDDMHQAQRDKLALICNKLNLTSSDHLLDIGCGWGGLAKYAAENYGCKVTGVNISREQLRYARETCAGLPIQFVDCDYRTIEGRFDKIVSVGMFEHVGMKNYRTFMKTAHRCLKDNGIFLLHSIGCNTSSLGRADPWIARYIFPNGMLPSSAQLAKAAEKLFVMEDWHNIGPHYDKTLMAWNANFQRNWRHLKDKYDMAFKRMWEYYLTTCAGAFRARRLQVWQAVMTRQGSGTSQPQCRDFDVLRPREGNKERIGQTLP